MHDSQQARASDSEGDVSRHRLIRDQTTQTLCLHKDFATHLHKEEGCVETQKRIRSRFFQHFQIYMFGRYFRKSAPPRKIALCDLPGPKRTY